MHAAEAPWDVDVRGRVVPANVWSREPESTVDPLDFGEVEEPLALWLFGFVVEASLRPLFGSCRSEKLSKVEVAKVALPLRAVSLMVFMLAVSRLCLMKAM